MSLTPETANSWLCDRCGMTASVEGGERIVLPSGWADGDEGRFCLVCRRERAAEAALDEAPADASHKARADLRRDAILGFEVTRDPGRPNAAIAQACRSSVSAVATVRRRLGVPEAEAQAPRSASS